MPHSNTERVVNILELLSCYSREGLTFTEISSHLHIPKGSLHPVLATLHDRNFIIFNQDNKHYYLGEALFSLGTEFVNSRSILERIGDVLESTSIRTSATCYLGVLSGGNVLYLLRNSASFVQVQVVARPGSKFPAYSTGLGKALLSNLSFDELRKLYPNGLTPLTPKTVTDFTVLYRQLQDTNVTGFSFESEESSLYVRCVGTPIKYQNRRLAAISIAFPIGVEDEENINTYKNYLMEARSSIETIIASNPGEWIYS